MLKEKVLHVLEKEKGEIVTGGRLANLLAVSRTAIWKAIRSLQEEGNEIVSIPNRGYQLMGTNDTLSETSIQEQLTTTFVGQKLTLLPVVHSTIQYIKELDTADIPNGYVVLANEQTKGRGRRARVFLSPKGGGAYLSILLKPKRQHKDIRLLTICAAVAVSKAVERVCGIRADIKWVNDIYCNGKKICGILTEATISGELQELNTAVVGIGINTSKIPSEIADIATSIQEQTDMRGIRNRLVAEILNQFEDVYLAYTEREETQQIVQYYESRLFITGKWIWVNEINQRYRAVVMGIDEEGALIVKDEAGEFQHVITGEIEWERG